MSNMYPDLNNEDNRNLAGGDQLPPTTYQSTTTTTETEKKQQKKKQKDTCCILGAKIWVTIIGLLNLVLGLFVVIVSLYAKFGYNGYQDLSATLPTGGIWMIFGFGIVLTVCSVVLILAACFYDLVCFQIILVVFAIVLSLLLILEVASASFMLWGLGIIALPDSSVTNAAADRLLQVRNATVFTTWQQCCVENHPPYDLMNVTKIDAGCLWPNSSPAVKQSCGSQNVLECVCKSETAYGSYFGMFLQSNLAWVGIVTIILAIMLLAGLIATCVLICAKKKKSDAMYHAAADE